MNDLGVKMKVKYYTDPGHGWVAVKRKLLNDLGIADKITYFSYQKGQTVYLEEDCDLATFTTAMNLRGVILKYEQKHTNRTHPIRNYENYRF
jgi:hypothetical protein